MAEWWAEHRPASGDLFVDELDATLRLLGESPGAGTRWPTEVRPDLRRGLMPRSGNFVYYRVDEVTRTVHVLAIWGSSRGRRPRL